MKKVKKFLSKRDIFYAIVIGEACALIFLLIKGWLDLPEVADKIIFTFPVVLPILSTAGLVFVAFLGQKWLSIFQAGKNMLVGTLNSTIDLGILNLLIFTTGQSSGNIILLFKALSFTGASVNSYLWNKFWTFEDKGDVGVSQFSKFYSVALGGLLIHEVVIYTIVNLIGPQFNITPEIWTNVGNIAAIIMGFFWNFAGYKFLVFKK